MSTHEVKIIEVGEIYPHPDADRLEITIADGWQVVLRKGEFKTGDKAVYVEPDYMVPVDRPEFSFLKDKRNPEYYRLKAVRLRGKLSYGLLVHVPAELDSLPVGADVREALKIKRYIPVVPTKGADAMPRELWPVSPVFDVEQLHHQREFFYPEEEVVCTEKIHGASFRAIRESDGLKVGSRKRWLQGMDSVWGRALTNAPGVQEFLRRYPRWTVYGEVVPTQSLKYGRTEPTLTVFALLSPFGDWVGNSLFEGLTREYEIDTPPVLFRGKFKDINYKIVEQDSIWSLEEGQEMEGMVIVPVVERRVGRAQTRLAAKYISDRYWTKPW